MGRTIHVDADEFREKMRAGGPSTADDGSITMDGRRLDSKEAVLAWLAEQEQECLGFSSGVAALSRGHDA